MTNPTSSAEHDALPPGTRFGELEIRHVIGVGGFGIVYLAYDHSLERDVALKEYMPSSLAARGQGPVITVRSASHAETYAVGLRSFVNEARMLARFDHPSMVKVYRFWEANGTAYMVMPFLEGRTLRDARRAMTAPPDETWMRGVLDPVLSAVELLHREGVFHRDIAPDNILLLPEGRPMLLDFGAARRVISDRTQSLTAILKPSYAPIEQYAEIASLRQGPWTDLYAFGAVIHFLLFGVPPSPATARAVQDDLSSLLHAAVPGVSPQFLAATAWALALKPADRPQSVAEFRAALDGRTQPPPMAAAPAAAQAATRGDTWDQTVITGPAGPTQTMPLARPATLDTPGATVPPRSTTVPVPPVPRPAPAGATVAVNATPSGGGRGMMVGGSVAAVAVLVAAAGWWMFGGSGKPAAVDAAAPAASAAVATAPAASAAVATVPAPAPVEAPVVAAPPPAPAVPVEPPVAVPTAAATPSPSPAAVVAPAAAAVRPKPIAAAPAPRTEPVTRPVAKNADSGALQPRPATYSAPPSPAPAETVVRAQPPAVESAPTSTSAAQPSPYNSSSVALPKPAGPASAREACGSRLLIALAICMDRQCARPELASGSDCRKYLEDKRRRDQQRGVPSN